MEKDLASRFEAVRARMQQACGRAGRDPVGVTLLAVSKGHGPETVTALAQWGQVDFGENKIQEAKVKIPQCPGHLKWHMIGHLQTNKVRDAVQWFDMVQGVDSFRVAEELQKAAEKASKTVKILLEVNVAGEATKYGFAPGVVVEELLKINAFPRLEIHGLMGMAPWSPQPERARPVFRRLAGIRRECEQALGAPLPVLSMGMSEDFEVAIEEGATLIRVGTLLFGERTYAKASAENVDA